MLSLTLAALALCQGSVSQFSPVSPARSPYDDSAVLWMLGTLLLVALIGALLYLVRERPDPPPPDPWAAALTNPARPVGVTKGPPERVDGTFGSYVGKGFAGLLGILVGWVLVVVLFPVGLLLVPFLLRWLWPKKPRPQG